MRFGRRFDEARRLLDEAEAICEKHEFKEFTSAIGRNRGAIERESAASQAPAHTLAEMLESYRELVEYRPDLAVEYLAFWYFVWKTELLSALRSGPLLSLMVVTDNADQFMRFAARFRHLADHFLMQSSGEPTVDVKTTVTSDPAPWRFPATFPFLFMKRDDADGATKATARKGPTTMRPRVSGWRDPNGAAALHDD